MVETAGTYADLFAQAWGAPIELLTSRAIPPPTTSSIKRLAVAVRGVAGLGGRQLLQLAA